MRWLVVAITVAGGAACASPELTHAHPSAESLARAVLESLAQRSESQLAALALDEREFRQHVWPSLPAARPERNLPFAYVWGDLEQKSTTFLNATIARHAGRSYELVNVSFTAGTSSFSEFRIHRAAVFAVRDSHGNQQDLRVCGSLIERNGRWKVFSYVADD